MIVFLFFLFFFALFIHMPTAAATTADDEGDGALFFIPIQP